MTATKRITKWPTLSLDIEPDTGRIHLHGGGKRIVETLQPGEWTSCSVGDYTITFARKRDRDRKIIKLGKRKDEPQP